MRKVNVRKFRENLAAELRDLPFEITKDGRVIAVVCDQAKGAKPADPEKRESHKAQNNVDFNPQPKKG